MLSIDSAHPQKVDGMLRNQWTTCSGFGGRLAPVSVVAFDRITQTAFPEKTPVFLSQTVISI